MSAPYILNTPAQRRAFILLTLAQMVHLEHTGTTLTHTSARAQAIAMLDMKAQDGANGITANELIAALRVAAVEARGLLDATAPTKPIPPLDPTT